MNFRFYRSISLLVVVLGVGASVMSAGPVASASGSQIPVGGPRANVTGVFGPVVNWPLIPLHAVLLPGGSVMSYGTDASGGTITADGKVLVTGGSVVSNELTGVAYQAEIWDPATGHWTAGASAAVARLYHSNALLLNDATVLTGGGGAPVPWSSWNSVINLPTMPTQWHIVEH